ncbi:MAG: hypothetical protein R2813_00220 [Flavobacteriales bacterium]
MQELVKTLSIQKDMCDALLRRGYLGRQPELIEAQERGEFDHVQSISRIGFSEMHELTQMELEAAAWANQINEALKLNLPNRIHSRQSEWL